EDGVLAGIPVALKVFEKIDPNLKISILINDGTVVKKGDIAFYVEGAALSILSAERTVLNFMQRLSGIATKAYRLSSLLKSKGKSTIILDTRKTTPGLRELEKYAVKVGGCQNHRMGLWDMIMIKDNHIDYAGNVENAIMHAKKYLEQTNKNLKIEVEVRNMEELKKVLGIGNVQRIMLDNFTPLELKDAVKYINGRVETEASGGINEINILEYADTGVDYISIGDLTHNIKSLDMSLKAIK
ncbi:MAG TPA: carboxylating nicotinate-nucleotide diphosphorylase, partial [Bacteroidales bacterium]|nr:carboxylating nicotinate-nucleotide diphosphorylase [Bacteroidales bacterium]